MATINGTVKGLMEALTNECFRAEDFKEALKAIRDMPDKNISDMVKIANRALRYEND